MTNTRAAHFGRAIQLTIKYGSELEQLHHQYKDGNVRGVLMPMRPVGDEYFHEECSIDVKLEDDNVG